MSAAKNAVTAFEIKRALAEKHYKDFFITECKSGPTQIAAAGTLKILDGLAIKKSWTAPCFTGYEIKVSRSDFLRDVKFYTYEELCNCLYIVCPKGMIDRTELPESIGLMYYDPEKKTLTTRKRAIYRKIEYTPELLLPGRDPQARHLCISAQRRRGGIGQSPVEAGAGRYHRHPAGYGADRSTTEAHGGTGGRRGGGNDMMKLLIGGSPCTHWSIAQTKNRETEPSGIGWELFKNYLVALEKYKPDFFLYENNKSMSAAIREQITKELGVEPIEINSALVSAQSRKRLYWTNIPGVGQPEDKGILLRDILETGVVWREKAYTLKANYTNAGAVNGVDGGHFPAPMAAEPVRIGTIESSAEGEGAESRQYRVYSPDGKGVTLAGTDGGGGVATGLYAAPLRVGDMPNAAGEISGSQSGRSYSTDGKSVSLQARPNGGGADGAATGLYAVPAGIAWRGRGDSSSYEMRDDQKANAVTADGHQSRLVVEDAAIFQQPRGFNKGGIKYEKTPTLTANGDWAHNNLLIESADGKTHPVYEVRDGQIAIKGKQYPTKLADGFYIIRKLTVTECKRLQTVPDDYVFPVSDTQAYKMLGNGWTVDVIAHILSHAPGITTEPVEVLSMYDGMSCGHIALNKIGAAITKYYATEIDKYAIQTTQHNFPDTIQLGDAFQVRDDGWKIESEGPREAVAAPAVIGRPEELPGPAAGVSNAVIKYPGAKWGVAPWVISHFPEHRSYLEPFFGSGAVLFTKSRSAIETVNDIDGDVVNLFDWIKKDPARLAHAIRFTPYARDEYDRAWAAQYTETDNFRRAVNFYIRMMMGHGFRTTGEKVGWKNDVQGREAAYAAKCWAKTPEVIIQAAERLRGVQIENRPAVELIRRFNYPNVLIYADPPYMLGTRQNRKQYRHEMTDDDHMELLEAIKAHRGPAIISGYDSDLYNRELKGWYKDGRTSFTQAASRRREILWMNFEPAAQMDMFREG